MRPTLYPVQCEGPGRLSTMARPRGGDWLEDEMRGLREHGIHVLVSALTVSEMAELDLTQEPDAARGTGLEFVALPVGDRGVPDRAAAVAVCELPMPSRCRRIAQRHACQYALLPLSAALAGP